MTMPNKVQPPNDGLQLDCSADDQVTWDAVSISRLKHFEKSPAHVWAYLNLPPTPSTDAQLLGVAIHTAVLEPDQFPDEYYQSPEGDGRTKVVKAARAEAELANPGKVGLKPGDWAACEGIRLAVSQHEAAADLLGGEGHNEASYVWTDGVTGVRCKARVDRLRQDVIVDIKSIAVASNRMIEYAIRDYSYHIQGAHYIDGIETIYAQLPSHTPAWVLVFVEKAPPYGVRVIQVDEPSLELGRRKRDKWLAQYRICVSKDHWPAYSQGTDTLGVPDWEFKREELEEAS